MSDTQVNTLTQNSSGQTDMFKWFMGIVSTVLTAAMLYVGTTLVSLQISMAEVRQDVSAIKVAVAEINEDTRTARVNNYTKDTAEADRRVQEGIDDRQNYTLTETRAWAGRLSDRLASVEQKMRDTN